MKKNIVVGATTLASTALGGYVGYAGASYLNARLALGLSQMAVTGATGVSSICGGVAGYSVSKEGYKLI
jgi:hypothetical protein